jgi:hypothetical protein
MTPLLGHSLGGRPVTEIVTPVNMGNQPHCDNGEGVAFGLSLTHSTEAAVKVSAARLRGLGDHLTNSRSEQQKLNPTISVARFTGLKNFCRLYPGFRFASPWALCFRPLRRAG